MPDAGPAPSVSRLTAQAACSAALPNREHPLTVPRGVSSSLAHERHRHTHLHLLQCQENKRATTDPAWLSISVLRKVRRLFFQLGDPLASQKTLAEETVTAKTKKCSNCVKLATALTRGHQRNVVDFMAICIALPKRIRSSVYRCTNKVLVSLPLAV